MVDHFFEVSGVLGSNTNFGPSGTPAHRKEGRVVLSNLSRGSAGSQPQPCPGLKYVASGVEVYRYGGKAYPVSAGQFLYVPELHLGEVEIGRSDSPTALGLCVYLPEIDPAAAGNPFDAPMIFPAACSELGRLLSETTTRMLRSGPGRAQVAETMLGQVAEHIEPLMEETCRIIDGIAALKPSTRYETLRRLNVARSYLHAVTDRSVELAELAKIAGISRFQLLRSFRDAFGAPPAAYHRNLRLKLAKNEIDGKLLSCSEAAHRFGFADCSSFSHAYRRAFGDAPIRSLAAPFKPKTVRAASA
jgi:AraC-like DNA-binding protein